MKWAPSVWSATILSTDSATNPSAEVIGPPPNFFRCHSPRCLHFLVIARNRPAIDLPIGAKPTGPIPEEDGLNSPPRKVAGRPAQRAVGEPVTEKID